MARGLVERLAPDVPVEGVLAAPHDDLADVAGFRAIGAGHPVPDEGSAAAARAILDGHIILSRLLADSGHYPAIDIEGSISRVMPALLSQEELDLVRRFKQLYSRFQRSRDLISVGAYVRGSDPEIDEAIAMYPRLEAFLRQGIPERFDVIHSRDQLAALLNNDIARAAT